MDILEVFEIQCTINNVVIFTIDTKNISEYDYQSVFEITLKQHANVLRSSPQDAIVFNMYVRTPQTTEYVRSDRLNLMYRECRDFL